MHAYCRSIFSNSFLATPALAQLGTMVTLPPLPASPYEPQDAEVVPEGQPAAELAALGFIRQLRFHPARAQCEVFGEVESHQAG